MDRKELVQSRFRMALDLFELSESMLRLKLMRKHPSASRSEIDEMFVTWLETRPGAEIGDGPGRRRQWPPSERP